MSAKHTALRRVSRRELFYLPLVTAIPALAQRRTADTPAGDVSLYQGVLLSELQARACRYFIEQSHSETGLVRDRVRVEGRDDRRVASIAATGFGLSALCIADRKRITPKGEAANRVLTTLRFLARTADHRNGFFPHFLDAYTGERIWRSEFSSVDTAWALCGVLHCRVHFSHPEIRALADELLGRADWRWMLAGGQTLSHGWTPEHGFLPYRWDSYSELMAMYLLALGSSTSAIPASSWNAWSRPVQNRNGRTYIGSDAPLFAHQYSHAWFDFRNHRDQYADYFANSQEATLAHRDFCAQLAPQYPWYSESIWGVTASDSRTGYVAWGGPALPVQPDGTLVPCAAGGSIVFLPENCAAVLERMLTNWGNRIWNRYGFVDAFHPGEDWFCPDVIGINVGIMLLMAENLRTQSVWNAIASTPEATRAFTAAGLKLIA
jgi:hypothetical protein